MRNIRFVWWSLTLASVWSGCGADNDGSGLRDASSTVGKSGDASSSPIAAEGGAQEAPGSSDPGDTDAASGSMNRDASAPASDAGTADREIVQQVPRGPFEGEAPTSRRRCKARAATSPAT
jgi:hypothetical protein